MIAEDFEWATSIILSACTRLNSKEPVPCVSILEGGYCLTALAESAFAHCRILNQGHPRPAAPGDEVAALSEFLESVGISANS